MFPDHRSFIDPLRHVPRSCRRSVTRGGSRHLAGRRPVRGGTPVGHGESPPAPERTVEGNDRHELVALCAGEVELGRKELLLGLEDLEVTRDAVIVALERKRDRRLKRLYRLGALGVHALELLPRDEGVRHLRERLQRGLLVALDGFFPGGRARPIAREKPSTLEERTGERAADGPHLASALDQILELAALAAVQFFFSSRRRHTRCYRDWSSDVCSSDLMYNRREGPWPGTASVGG